MKKAGKEAVRKQEGAETPKKAAYKCKICGYLVGMGEHTPEMFENELCAKCLKAKNKEAEAKPKTQTPAQEKPDMEQKISQEFVRHDFTSTEMDAMQKDLALKTSEFRAKENEKSAVTKQLGADIESFKSIIGSLADKINAGFEHRSMDCKVIYDWKKNEKRIMHPETGLVIRTLDISAEERQQKLELEEKK